MRPSPLIRSTHRDHDDRPFIVIWEVTRACQLVCRHCRADATTNHHPLQLTTDEGKALLDDLASLGAPRPLVVLTGGDPFERDDLAELVAHGTTRGLSIALSPSVTPRLTFEALASMRAAGARAVSLSLDGARPDTHDGMRGVEGVFVDTLAAARLVREANLRLQLNTTVTRDNACELPEMLEHVLELDAGLWSVFFLVPTGRGTQLKGLDADATEDVLHWLYDVSRLVAIKTTEAPQFRRVVVERASDVPDHGALYAHLRERSAHLFNTYAPRTMRPPLDVNAARGFAFVDHLGIVYPSGFLPIAAGTIRSRPFTQIYRTSPLLRALRDPTRLQGRCGTCELKSACGGSRSRAFAVYGDVHAEDPACAHALTDGGVLGGAMSDGSKKVPSSSR